MNISLVHLLWKKERMEMNDDDYAHYFSKQEESPEFDSLYGSI